MRLFTSESVTPGHPDKLCDQISDAILDAYLEADPLARVAVETMATARGVILAGEVTSRASVSHDAVAAQVLREVGYHRYAELPILDRIVPQSREISEAVTASLEARSSAPFEDLDEQGAGDQGLMFGYACSETADLMPLPITIAHALARRLFDIVRDDRFEVLGPDGKTQVTVAYGDDGAPSHVASVLVSTQHAAHVAAAPLRRIVTAEIVLPVLAELGLSDDRTEILINPSGSFIVGGPRADAGLTGRKIIVDTYGGAARHGGGAFSGKDPSKVDRSGAYAMRWVAKHVVAAGLASRCEVQVAYAIGSALPVGVYVETFGTGSAGDDRIASAIRQVFDLRPAAIIRDLELLRPIFFETSAFGHFGARDFPWERLSPSRIAGLQIAAAAGLDAL